MEKLNFQQINSSHRIQLSQERKMLHFDHIEYLIINEINHTWFKTIYLRQEPVLVEIGEVRIESSVGQTQGELSYPNRYRTSRKFTLEMNSSNLQHLVKYIYFCLSCYVWNVFLIKPNTHNLITCFVNYVSKLI